MGKQPLFLLRFVSQLCDAPFKNQIYKQLSLSLILNNPKVNNFSWNTIMEK